MQIDQIMLDVRAEFDRATSKNAPMNSAHEGYAVLLEEVDELWDEVKKNHFERSKARMRNEAIQVTAMGLRFIHDVIDAKPETKYGPNINAPGFNEQAGIVARMRTEDAAMKAALDNTINEIDLAGDILAEAAEMKALLKDISRMLTAYGFPAPVPALEPAATVYPRIKDALEELTKHKVIKGIIPP